MASRSCCLSVDNIHSHILCVLVWLHSPWRHILAIVRLIVLLSVHPQTLIFNMVNEVPVRRLYLFLSLAVFWLQALPPSWLDQQWMTLMQIQHCPEVSTSAPRISWYILTLWFGSDNRFEQLIWIHSSSLPSFTILLFTLSVYDLDNIRRNSVLGDRFVSIPYLCIVFCVLFPEKVSHLLVLDYDKAHPMPPLSVPWTPLTSLIGNALLRAAP